MGSYTRQPHRMSEQSPETKPQTDGSSRADVQPLVEIDPRGDLVLIVHEGKPDETVGTKRAFLVCSRTLARSTKYFETMLDGRWKESKPSDTSDSASQWTVSLFEDHPDAFEVVLNIVHCKSNQFPETVRRSVLYKILILADKYIMVHNLRWIVPAW